MQLKPLPNIRHSLALASASLLAQDASSAEESQWDIETALLYYRESQRVTAVEGIFSATKQLSDEASVNYKVTLDSLTGASPSGAVVQPQIQTFTRPSGNGSYEVAAGLTPLDDTFKDTRLQMNAQWTRLTEAADTLSYGLHLSKEYDYFSLGANGSWAVDFNQKNTTLSMGLSTAYDKFDPEGGIPNSFSAMTLRQDHPDEASFWQAFRATRRAGNDDKHIVDLLVGVTQVINRRTLMLFNYSFSTVSGYQTDPFKVLSSLNESGISQAYLYEKRPDQRRKRSIYWQTKYHGDHSIWDVSYRYMNDTWKVRSHTLDVKWHIPTEDTSTWQPHLRWYRQQEAAFYRPYLNQQDALPSFASADPRLGRFDAVTLGIKYSWVLDNGQDMALRIEYYRQNHESPFALLAPLSTDSVFPDINALIVQLNYSL